MPFVILASFLFFYLLLQFGQNSVRLSDTNIYAVMASRILDGGVLYRDMFLTNLPLFPYISSLYQLLTGGNLELFYATALIEVVGIALLIFVSARKTGASDWVSLLATGVYLFSVTVLATSTHQTGIFFAVLNLMAAYYCHISGRPVLKGIFLGLAFMTKAYTLPIVLALLVAGLPEMSLSILRSKNTLQTMWIKLKPVLVQTYLPFLAICVAVIIPTLIFAWEPFITQTFGYSLSRPAGIQKTNIILFMLRYDWLLCLLWIYSIFQLKRYRLIGSMSILFLLFFLSYQDTYLFYLNMILPFLALQLPRVVQDIARWGGKGEELKKWGEGGVILLAVVSNVIAIPAYLQNFAQTGIIRDTQRLITVLKNEEPTALYGSADIAPALSYLSGIPLLNGVLDTNANLYVRGIYSATEMTTQALEEKTLLISQGISLPLYSIEETITSDIFDVEQVKKQCTVIYEHQVQAEGGVNRIYIWRCYGNNHKTEK
jgi:hypothetical protein